MESKLDLEPRGGAEKAFEGAVRPDAVTSAIFAFLFILAALPDVLLGPVEMAWLMQSALLGSVLAGLAAIDLRTFRLPDYLTLPLLVVGLMLAASNGSDALLMRAAGAAFGFCMLEAVARAYHYWRKHRGLGFGDVKLMAASGAWVGADQVTNVVLIGCGLALLAIVATAAFGRDVGLGQKIPFGTALAAATWLVWLYGGVGG